MVNAAASPGPPGPGAASKVRAADARVTWRPSRHARRLLTLAVAALLSGLLTRNPAVAAVAGPPLLLLGMSRLGPGRSGTARVAGRDRLEAAGISVGLSSTRIYEGEPAAADVSVAGGDYDARWSFEPGRGIEPGSAAAVNGPAARFTFEVPRWGKRAVGTVTLSRHDRWRLAEGRVTFTLPPVDCYPSPAVQRTEVVLARLPNRLGEHRARVPGDGTEFNGVREFVPGDRQRAINWPASTRLGRLQVNTFSAERSQDVVLLVDATSDVGEPGESALDLGLRGAAGAARAYLAARDRVGVITYAWGGAHWLAPSLGRRQSYKIIDTLLMSDTGYARGAVFSRLPRADLADGAGSDPVLAARARRPGGALGREGAAGHPAGPLHPPPAGDPPVTSSEPASRGPGTTPPAPRRRPDRLPAGHAHRRVRRGRRPAAAPSGEAAGGGCLPAGAGGRLRHDPGRRPGLKRTAAKAGNLCRVIASVRV